jgi:hypothetical protein
MFNGSPGGLTISGDFDWGSESGLTDFSITVTGFSSLTFTNTDGGIGDVNPPALNFVYYIPDPAQKVTLAGSLDAALPTTIGESVAFSGTYSYFLVGSPDGDLFTVQGTITAGNLAAPEPAPVYLLAISSAILVALRFQRFRGRKLKH